MVTENDADYFTKKFITQVTSSGKKGYRNILEICREPANMIIIYYNSKGFGRRQLWNIMHRLVQTKLVEVYSNHPYTWKTTSRGLRLLQKRPAEGNILQYILKGE